AVVVGIDPEVVVVAVGGGDLLAGFAAVGAFVEVEVVDIDGVGIDGIGSEVGVVPGAGGEILVVGDFFPGGALVVGAVETAFFGVLDQGPDAAGAGGGGGDGGLTPGAGGETLAGGDVGPGFAGVGRLPETGVGTAGGEHREGAVGLPD